MCKYANICSDYPELVHMTEQGEECEDFGCCKKYNGIRAERISEKHRRL